MKKNGTVMPLECDEESETVLLCESLRTRIVVNVIGQKTPEDAAVQTCDEFADREGVSPLVFLIKAVIISGFLLAAETILRILLLASQIRHKEGKTRSSAFLARKGFCCGLAALFLILVTIGALAVAALGGLIIGGVAVLWGLFGLGMFVSLLLKFLVLSPIKIFFLYLIKKKCPMLCACCPCMIDDGDFFDKDEFEAQSRRDEYDLDALEK